MSGARGRSAVRAGWAESGTVGELTAIVTPLPEELAGLLGRISGLRRERLDGLAAHRGTLGGRPVVAVATGDGARNAERSLRTVVAAWAPRRVLVLGAAAGLSAQLEVGQVVVAERLLDADGPVPPPDRSWSRAAGPSCLPATVFSARRIAVTAQEKRAARDLLSGDAPAVLDIESAALARTASRAGLSFVVLRAVSDRLDEDLPLDFNLFIGEDGGVRRGEVARYVAWRPRLIGSLLDLRRRMELCADRLAAAAEEVMTA